MFDVFGFYKFIKISYLKKNQKKLLNQLLNKNIRGTIIISNEGLNGTISGKNKDIKLIKNYLHKLFKFEKFDSVNNSKSFFQYIMNSNEDRKKLKGLPTLVGHQVDFQSPVQGYFVFLDQRVVVEGHTLQGIGG